MGLNHLPHSTPQSTPQSTTPTAQSEGGPPSFKDISLAPYNPHSAERLADNVWIFRLSANVPMTKEDREALSVAKGQLQVNYYTLPTTHETNLIAVGTLPLQQPGHTEVNRDTCLFLRRHGVELGIFESQLQAEELIPLMIDLHVAGSSNNGFKVRLENHLLSSSDHPKMRDTILSKYRSAILAAEVAANHLGGDVSLNPQGTNGRCIAMALGEFHRVDASSQDGAGFILKQKRELPTGSYYYALSGTRYKSLQQLTDDLFEGTNSTPRYQRRSDCLQYLGDLASYIHPCTTNLFGTREAQLFLLDPYSKSLVNSVNDLNRISLSLSALRNNLDREFHSDKSWGKKSSKVKALLQQEIALLSRTSHELVHSDDLNNTGYVKTLSAILRGHTSLIDLGDQHHSPLTAARIGRFIETENNERIFAFDQDIHPSHRKIIEKVLESFPEASQSDWLTLFTTNDGPLTESYHPPKHENDFGRSSDDSVIVMFGNFGAHNHELVIRHDDCSPDMWPKMGSPRVKALLEQYTPEELSELGSMYKSWQFTLFNRIANLVDPNDPNYLSPFKRLGEFEYRPYLPGLLVSRLGRHDQSIQQVSAYMRLLGPVALVNFLSQRPCLPLSELLVQFNKDKITPISLKSIGISESFSGPTRSGDRSRASINHTVQIYSALVASWIVSHQHSVHAASRPKKELLSTSRKLTNTFLDSFKGAFLTAISNRENFDDVKESYSNFQNELDKPIPTELNLPEHLVITNKLLRATPDFVDAIIAGLKSNIELDILRFNRLLAGFDSTHSEGKERLLDAAYALLDTYHNSRVSHEFGNIIDGREISIQMHDFDLLERRWILAIAEVGVLSDAAPKSDKHKELYRKAFASGVTFDSFYSEVVATKGATHLTYSRALRFYEAVQGLYSKWLVENNSEKGKKISAAVYAASRSTLKFSQV